MLLPAIMPFLKKHPEVTSACLSFLEKGKRIKPHRGPFRGVLRYHLTLHCKYKKSSRDCRLRISDQWFAYKEGEPLLWDDTYEHEVINQSAGERVALLMDIARPGLPKHLSLINKSIIRLIGIYCWLQRARFRAHAITGKGRGSHAKASLSTP